MFPRGGAFFWCQRCPVRGHLMRASVHVKAPTPLPVPRGGRDMGDAGTGRREPVRLHKLRQPELLHPDGHGARAADAR